MASGRAGCKPQTLARFERVVWCFAISKERIIKTNARLIDQNRHNLRRVVEGKSPLRVDINTSRHLGWNTIASLQLSSRHWLDISLCRLSVGEVLWRLSDAVKVAEEIDAGALNGLLNELALALVLPECVHEAGLAVGTVVRAHDLADGIRCLASVVERNGGNQVVENVGADDVVEEVGVDETEVTVDGGSGSASEVPGVVVVVWEGSVSVLEEGDGN